MGAHSKSGWSPALGSRSLCWSLPLLAKWGGGVGLLVIFHHHQADSKFAPIQVRPLSSNVELEVKFIDSFCLLWIVFAIFQNSWDPKFCFQIWLLFAFLQDSLVTWWEWMRQEFCYTIFPLMEMVVVVVVMVSNGLCTFRCEPSLAIWLYLWG